MSLSEESICSGRQLTEEAQRTYRKSVNGEMRIRIRKEGKAQEAQEEGQVENREWGKRAKRRMKKEERTKKKKEERKKRKKKKERE